MASGLSSAATEPLVAPKDRAEQQIGNSGFGVLHPVTQSLYDPRQGLYKDGRVRNPVPSKLKGKTDARKGNFGVMLMDLNPKGELLERDAAAKRTSERTELAAKLAQKDGYVPLKRVKHVQQEQEDDFTTLDPAVAYAASAAAAAATSAAVAPASALSRLPRRKKPLTPSETKSEQARLLTLLRSLHPVLVVDQLCKALAFFGGIPGAPPPADGSFPESAEANGPGSVFINFMAEIFPKLGQGVGEYMSYPVRDMAEQARRRGRPRGSKSTRTRPEKGLRSRLLSAPQNTKSGRRPSIGESPPASLEDSWVDVDDVDDAVPDIDGGNDDRPNTSIMPKPSGVSCPAETDAPLSPADLTKPVTASTGSGAAHITRRRGRPKGSKNRPKGSLSGPSNEQRTTGSLAVDVDIGDVIVDASQPKKRRPGPGRPKGSKNRPKDSASSPARKADKQGREGSEILPIIVPEASNQSVAVTSVLKESMQHSLPQDRLAQQPSAIAPYQTLQVRGIQRPDAPNQKATKANTQPSTQVSTTSDLVGDISAAAVVTGESPRPVVKRGRKPQQGQALNSGAANVMNSPPAKRQKILKDSSQLTHVSGQAASSTDDGSGVPYTPEVQRLAHGPSFSSQHKLNGNSIEDSGLASARERSNRPASHSHSHARQQQPPQQVGPRMQQPFSSVQPGGAPPQAISKSPALGTYTTQTNRSPQSFYAQARPAHTRYGQQQQQQQSMPPQHQKQYRLPDSASTHMGMTTGPDSSQFNTTANALTSGDSGYHRVGTMPPQASFGGGDAASVKTSENNYGPATSHQAQHQSPRFSARPTSHDPNSNIQSFHSYANSNFLGMASIGSSTAQTGLGINTTTYTMGAGSVQRVPGAAATSSFGSSSSMDHSSFDGSLAEPALRERMYHTLGRR